MTENKKDKKTILLTGAAGFIGFHTTQRLLDLGHKVIGVDNLNDYYDPELKKKRLRILGKNKKNFKFIKINLEDKNFIKKLSKEKFTEIIHLGAQAGVRYSIENPHAYAYSNYIGTLNIFELAKLKKLKRVVYASSSSVYGNSKPPFSEVNSDTNTPISVYAATKKATEVLAHTYTHLFGITTVGLRFFTVYGTYYRPDMAMFKFAKSILSGKPLTLYAGGFLKRGFTHIDDIVDGILSTLQIEKGYHIVNLGGNELIEVNTLVKLLEKYLDKKAIIKNLPMQAGDVAETESVQTIAKELLNFSPKINFEDGVKEFSTWFLENQKWLLKLKDGKQ